MVEINEEEEKIKKKKELKEIRMGKTCKLKAVSFQFMTKFTTN